MDDEGDEPRLLVERDDIDRLLEARGMVLLVGGYDGSRNMGDVAQYLTAKRTVTDLGLTPVVVLEAALRGEVDTDAPAFADTVMAWFDTPPYRAEDLIDIRGLVLPDTAVRYLYGGGYLNDEWGDRKLAMARTIDDVLSIRGVPLSGVISGVQVSPSWADGRPWLDALIERTSVTTTRDPESRDALAAACPGADIRLGADDAVLSLPDLFAPTGRDSGDPPRVAVHLNLEPYSAADAKSRTVWLHQTLNALVEQVGPLHVLQAVAYEDARISEIDAGSGFRSLLEEEPDRFTTEIVELQLSPLEPPDQPLRVDLVLSASYHMTLAGHMGAVPSCLYGENDYYRQKAAGLEWLVDPPGDHYLDTNSLTPDDAAKLLAEQLRADPRAPGQRVDRLRAVAAGDRALVQAEILRDSSDQLRASRDWMTREWRASVERASKLQFEHARVTSASDRILEELHHTRRVIVEVQNDRDAVVAHAERVEAELAAIKATRSYRLLDRPRRIYARIRRMAGR